MLIHSSLVIKRENNYNCNWKSFWKTQFHIYITCVILWSLGRNKLFWRTKTWKDHFLWDPGLRAFWISFYCPLEQILFLAAQLTSNSSQQWCGQRMPSEVTIGWKRPIWILPFSLHRKLAICKYLSTGKFVCRILKFYGSLVIQRQRLATAAWSPNPYQKE